MLRTTDTIVTFHRPFSLKGVDHLLPPADYRVVTEGGQARLNEPSRLPNNYLQAGQRQGKELGWIK